jgi:hypothetical protein
VHWTESSSCGVRGSKWGEGVWWRARRRARKANLCFGAEMVVSFEVVGETAVIDVEVVTEEYELGYEVLWFELPMDDEREMVGARRTSLVREGRRVRW